MKKGLIVAVALTLLAPAAALGQDAAADAQKRRKQIQLMEGLLARAAGLGADQVARKLQALEPGVTVLMGQPRARGFVLESYGVFFDVEVPALVQSVIWSQMILRRDTQINTALESLRRVLETLPAGPERAQAQQAFRRVELQVGPVRQGRQNRVPQPNQVSAANAAELGPIQSAGPAALDIPPGWDPLAEYTKAVQSELIDAMLEYSLNLGPDEWLTVAARDSHGPLTPGQIDDAHTIVLRVKGSDLAIYAADRSRREEIRGKVEVRVF